MYMPELGKSEVLKRVRAASTVGALCISQEALRRSIDALHARLNTYDLEVWSILHEWDMCMALVKELEDMLAAEESTDNEVEMRKEKEWYNVRRGAGIQQEVIVEEHRDEGEGDGEDEEDEEEDEDEDEPMRLSGLSVKVKGKCPAK